MPALGLSHLNWTIWGICAWKNAPDPRSSSQHLGSQKQTFVQCKWRMTWIPESCGSCRETQTFICTSHGYRWFGTKRRILGISSRMLKYQVALLEQDNVHHKRTTALNPSHVFLRLQKRPLCHDYLVTIQQVCFGRPDLKSNPIQDPELG